MEPNMFVDRIDELLKKQGKKRPDLYSNLNIPKNLIGQWKQRGTIPSADVAVKIAEYLGTSVEYLVTGKEPPVVEKIPADLQEIINKYAGKQSETDKKQKKDLTESKSEPIF